MSDWWHDGATWWYGQYGAPWREWYNSETGEPWMDDDARASASRRGPGRKGGKGQTPPGGQPPGPEVPVPVPAWETRRRAERNMAKPRKEPVKNEAIFFPPDQVVYATVQWVLKDYQNKDNPRLFSPIVDDINAMGCTISLRNHKPGQSSRVTIKGEKARDAFLEFLSRTADVFGDLDLTRVSNVQMHLGAEMLHEVKQTVDEAAKAGIV